MNQADWDDETLDRADKRCRTTHPERYRAESSGDAPPTSPCEECMKTEEARTKKLQKAHGTELGPEESAELMRRLGLDKTVPDPALADTLPGTESPPGGDRGTT